MKSTCFGDGALRFERPAGVSASALLAALRGRFEDVVVTEEYVCVTYDPRGPPPPLTLPGPGDAAAEAGRLVVVRVRYDGPDVDQLGLPREQVIGLHTGREVSVKLVGFLPGFAYLGDIDPLLVRPRRPSPRTRVPAGSVAIAGRYTGIYPFGSPGGWHLIGTAVEFIAFDLQGGASLRLGDRVRFEAA